MTRTITLGRQKGKAKESSKDKQPAGTKKKEINGTCEDRSWRPSKV